MSEPTFVLVFRNDVRECRKDGDHFIHVLNGAYVIHKDDPRILRIRSTAESDVASDDH